MSRLALFDAHCHLQDLRVAHCAPLLIKQASEVGVRWFAVNGTSEVLDLELRAESDLCELDPF